MISHSQMIHQQNMHPVLGMIVVENITNQQNIHTQTVMMSHQQRINENGNGVVTLTGIDSTLRNNGCGVCSDERLVVYTRFHWFGNAFRSQ